MIFESTQLLASSRDRLAKCRFSDDDPEVYGVSNSALEGERQNDQIRARLLADAVRLVPELMPDLHQMFHETVDQLQLTGCVEGYVYSDVAPQAQCVFVGGDTKAAVLISSGIIGLLDLDELKFVVGHELGHLIYGHHGYPDPRSARDDNERLNWLAMQRAAEISADRIGFLGSKSMDGAVRAIIKTSTGLESDQLRFDVGKYLDQLRHLTSLGGNADIVFASHPMFPVRMKALLWFEMSEPCAEIQGRSKKSALSGDQLDQRVAKDLESAGASVLTRIREESTQAAAVWAFLYVAIADNKLSKDEQAQLHDTFGDSAATNALQFVKDHGPDGVREKFELSMQKIRSHPITIRKQFVDSISEQFSRETKSRSVNQQMLDIIVDRLKIQKP